MGYRLKRKETAQKALRRIAREQIDKGLAELEDGTLDRDTAVHQVRKRCKKLRGLVRLMRGAMDPADNARENAHYRDTARIVAGLRESAVAFSTLEKLDAGADDEARAAIARARTMLPGPTGGDTGDDTGGDTGGSADGDEAEAQIRAFADALRKGRARLARIKLADTGFDAVAPGLAKIYRQGRDEMASARDSRDTGALHDWRKRVKYHWYHVRLLENLWPRPMHARAHELSVLSDLLGDDHDLADLMAALPDDDALAPLRRLSDRRRGALQERAFDLGARVYVEKPGAFEKRMKRHWKIWHA